MSAELKRLKPPRAYGTTLTGNESGDSKPVELARIQVNSRELFSDGNTGDAR